MRVIITGGTGLIGRALADSLAKDSHEVIILSRRPGRPVSLPEGVRMQYWDGKTADNWGDLVNEAGAIVNLAGEPIASFKVMELLTSRWTPARRRKILESRRDAGRAVVEAVRRAKKKPGVVIQSSAVGYYGPRGDEIITEQAEAGDDFLARVCQEWEDSTEAVEKAGVRRAIIRTGLVLSDKGGVLPIQMLPFRLFLGGPIGSGKQVYPWIHLDDEIAAIRYLIDDRNAEGAFNLSAPNPATNAEFGRVLGKVMGRPAAFPTPGLPLRLALGEMASLVLEGQRAVPQRLLEVGFEFKFTDLEAALTDLLKP